MFPHGCPYVVERIIGLVLSVHEPTEDIIKLLAHGIDLCAGRSAGIASCTRSLMDNAQLFNRGGMPNGAIVELAYLRVHVANLPADVYILLFQG